MLNSTFAMASPAKKGEISVKYTDDKGKEQQKTFRLTQDVKIFDETGRVAAIDVFEPQYPALTALSRRVKESFDPKGVLNPGRMWAGV